MTSVTIFGVGNMGDAIAEVLGAGGAAVDHISSSDTEKTVTGEIAILAVPYPALKDIIGGYRDQLAGKIVVDVTNPVDFETFDSLLVPAGSSASLELAVELPSARVLKAFNTTFATTLAAKTIGPNKTTVLVAGDDEDAKSTLISAITAGGVDALDVGALGRSHELEAIGLLQVTLAAAEKISWTGGLALVR
jgi:8-hydroxy-5-deazaflavin:NADPH oxidoreductase